MMKSVKSERVPSLKKYTALPLLLSADRDEDLVRLDYFVEKSYQYHLFYFCTRVSKVNL